MKCVYVVYVVYVFPGFGGFDLYSLKAERECKTYGRNRLTTYTTYTTYTTAPGRQVVLRIGIGFGRFFVHYLYIYVCTLRELRRFASWGCCRGAGVCML